MVDPPSLRWETDFIKQLSVFIKHNSAVNSQVRQPPCHQLFLAHERVFGNSLDLLRATLGSLKPFGSRKLENCCRSEPVSPENKSASCHEHGTRPALIIQVLGEILVVWSAAPLELVCSAVRSSLSMPFSGRCFPPAGSACRHPGHGNALSVGS